MVNAPFFRGRVVGREIHISGQPSQLLGPTAGLPAIDRSNSLFVEWSWDGGTLTVTNDRFGMAPAYYYASSSEIMVDRANELKMAALSILYEEAVKSFASGHKAAADFVAAYSRRFMKS